MRRFSAASAWPVLRLHPDLRDQLAAFASQFSVNLSLFGIVLVASFLLEPAEFVRLSLANSYIMIIAMVLDFGLSSAALKLSIENNQKHFVDFNVTLKAGLFLISVVMLVLTAAVAGPLREVTILTGAAGLAFWNATRVIEQYHRRFLRYAALNLLLAASRILFGGLALFTRNWATIVLAVYVVAQLPIHTATLARLFRQFSVLKGSLQRSELRMLRSIALPFFLNGLLYASIPVISQTAIYLQGDSAATAAFGIVLLFLGPLALLNLTLRIYVQPQVLLKTLSSVDAFGLGRGSLHILVGAFAALVLCAVPASFVLEWLYQARFPQVGIFFLIYFSTFCLVCALGLYNMRALRGRLIWVALAVNALRAALTAPLLLLPQVSALAIVIWSSLVSLGGELLLAWLLTIVSRLRYESRTVSE